MTKRIVSFTVILVVVFTAAFFAQDYLSAKVNEENLDLYLLQSYVANFILAIVGFLLLLLLSKKMGGLLGYIFLGYGFVKVAVFFAYFRPRYLLDDEISKIEFLSFFVPYFLALIVEIWALARILNKREAE